MLRASDPRCISVCVTLNQKAGFETAADTGSHTTILICWGAFHYTRLTGHWANQKKHHNNIVWWRRTTGLKYSVWGFFDIFTCPHLNLTGCLGQPPPSLTPVYSLLIPKVKHYTWLQFSTCLLLTCITWRYQQYPINPIDYLQNVEKSFYGWCLLLPFPSQHLHIYISSLMYLLQATVTLFKGENHRPPWF